MTPEIINLLVAVGIGLGVLIVFAAIGGAILIIAAVVRYIFGQQAAAQAAQAGARIADYGHGARTGLGVGAPGAPDYAVTELVIRDNQGRLVGSQLQVVGKPNGAGPTNAAPPNGNGGTPPPPPNP